MKPFLTTLASLVLFVGVTTPQAAQARTLTDIDVIPTRVLQRAISPKFYKSLLISPIEGWIVARGHLSGTRLTGSRVIRSELKGLYDPLALELAKEVVIAGNYSLDRPNSGDNVLVHLLVYQIADATLVLSFAHIDGSGGNQMAYYGCARLLVLKDNKWTEIKGPESLAGKGLAVRQGIKNDLTTSLKLEGIPKGPEATNMSTGEGESRR
jgi:hypothetical protein